MRCMVSKIGLVLMMTAAPVFFGFDGSACFGAPQSDQGDSSGQPDPAAVEHDPSYQQAVDYFVEVFKTMQEHYYQPVDPEEFKKFIYLFYTQNFSQLKREGKSDLYIKWRSAAYLVEALRARDDIFSMLFPPKDAAQYETEALGKRIDLGIDGELTARGFEVSWVEPRSDAHKQGLRPRDVIYQINSKKITSLIREEIDALFVREEGETVTLRYVEGLTRRKKKIMVASKEYFRKLAFMVPTGLEKEGIFCIGIQRFNRATGEDVTEYIRQIQEYSGETGLIIDLRGNPGGPPLAAREISGFFLEPGDDFAYFQRRGYPRSMLDIPQLPADDRYRGDMVILIDEESGSASELFSGILQRRGRAQLMGTSSAGQVFLKSMYHLSDGSMVLLVTARGHHPDGTVFSFDGLTPDIPADQDQDGDELIRYAARYLLEKRKAR